MKLNWLKTARENQLTPQGNWRLWLCDAGRGFGKTRTGAEDAAFFVCWYAHTRLVVIAPTRGDLIDTCFEGQSGLLSVLNTVLTPEVDYVYNRSRAEIMFRNGSYIKGHAAEKPDRLRGPQWHRAWCEEISSWKNAQQTWDMLTFGLRLMHPEWDKPQAIATSTPKPTPFFKKLRKTRRTVFSRGSTFDNSANLAPDFLEKVREDYEGTRLGRQELYGEMLGDVEGALWKRQMLEDARYAIMGNRELHPTPEHVEAFGFTRIVVSIDPAVTNTVDSDETGITVTAMNKHREGFLLADYSGKYSPAEWAKKAIWAYHYWQADRVVGEVNNGGDMIEHTLRMVDANIPFTALRASKGKAARAEPVVALYEQGRIKHLGPFATLEDQLCEWVPQSGDRSPDRLDALVWGFTELLLQNEFFMVE